MADALEAMLAGAADALATTDRRRIAEVRRLDDVLDRLNTAIKTYLTALDPEALSDADHRRLIAGPDVRHQPGSRRRRGRPRRDGPRSPSA